MDCGTDFTQFQDVWPPLFDLALADGGLRLSADMAKVMEELLRGRSAGQS